MDGLKEPIRANLDAQHLLKGSPRALHGYLNKCFARLCEEPVCDKFVKVGIGAMQGGVP